MFRIRRRMPRSPIYYPSQERTPSGMFFDTHASVRPR